MSAMTQLISPVDGRIYAERALLGADAVETALSRAKAAQAGWRATPVTERARLLTRFLDEVAARQQIMADEITWQMGRPISQSPGEIRGLLDRARHMIAIAEEALADIHPAAKDGFTRFVRREPLGLVFVIGAWNYPYLTSVNAVVPALMAGNSVILKAASQTVLTAERYAECFAAAGLPPGVFQSLHVSTDLTQRIIRDDRVDFINFTGSVPTGHAVQQAAAARFIGVGLELGGCDPAYVRADADLGHAVENLVDGAFFNSGQSCCGIQRIYVDASVHDEFVERAAALTREYRLGNPTDAATNLGPVVSRDAADEIRQQIAQSVAEGASALIDAKAFPADVAGSPYLTPQILLVRDHGPSVMRNEVFGPVVGIMKVTSDAQAIALMNDSAFGLTASVWTRDEAAALAIGGQVDTGTFFMNRCDYLDPALAWTGIKDSGRGATLSSVGYEHLTRPKSFHLRTQI